MDLPTLHRLLTPVGQQALSAAQLLEPREADFLPHLAFLRRTFPDDLARAALEIAILRREAQAKFHTAGQMYLKEKRWSRLLVAR